jgi:predicted lysophospholipase L1 biosynthesis ABC-type transport system permease subunit
VVLVLGESVLLCLAGVVPGVLAGAGLARLGVRIVERVLRAEGDAITLQISPATLGFALGAGVLISLGSALVPALQAVRWRIVDALDPFRRGQVPDSAPPDAAGRRPLLLLGCALSALALVVFFVLPTAFLSGNPSLIGTVVFCLLITILLGFTLVALGALPLLQRGLTRLLAPALGPAAELAARNLERHRRRHTTTAILFILSVSGVIFIASLAALFSRTAMSLVEHSNGADVRIQAEAETVGAAKGELQRQPGVAVVAEVNHLRGRTRGGVAYDVVMSDLVGLKQLWIVPFGVDGDFTRAVYLDRIQFEEGGPEALAEVTAFGAGESPGPVAAPSLPAGGEAGAAVIEEAMPAPPAVAPAMARAADEVAPLILSLAAARYLEVGQGDLVRLSFRLGGERRERRFRVAAVCGAMPGFENFRGRVAQAVGSGALLPRASFQSLTAAAPAEARLTRYFVRAADGEAGGRELAQRIRDSFDIRYRFGVRSTAERREEARKLHWVTQVLFGLLLCVAIVIAVFALIASMATAALERRWEIGVLRSLGLRRGQVFRMFLGEAAALALAAGLAGGAIGFGLAYLFVLQAAVLMEIPVAFTLPYGAFLATFAASLAAGALAAYIPTRSLLGRTPAEILRGGG